MNENGANAAVAPSGIITLLTDFGTRDPFVGVMKGVMLGLCPIARFVDLTHDIAPQDIAAASFWSLRVYTYFPAGTVHLVVVDPGVGSTRRALAASAHGHYFVGPDNGVLSGVLGDEAQVVQLPVPETASRTFHGRDVFAPAAAALACGRALASLGSACVDWTQRSERAPRIEASRARGEVVVVDHFGNLISNLTPDLGRPVSHVVCQGMQLRWVTSYADAEPGEIVALQNSWGLVEVAEQSGNAAERLGVRAGDPLELCYQAAAGG